MEYTTLWQPLTVIFISFSIGMFFGVVWMFYWFLDSQKELEKELDKKNIALDRLKQTLESYTHKYENDDYEAY
jgi:uncharacterized membrane-anchored protein YhcB (DUF1043 family)